MFVILNVTDTFRRMFERYQIISFLMCPFPKLINGQSGKEKGSELIGWDKKKRGGRKDKGHKKYQEENKNWRNRGRKKGN